MLIELQMSLAEEHECGFADVFFAEQVSLFNIFLLVAQPLEQGDVLTILVVQIWVVHFNLEL